MIIIGETKDIELSDLSEGLGLMKIDELNIVSISPYPSPDKINYSETYEPSIVKYIEVGVEDFTVFLNNSDLNFLEYNKNTLYIIRNGNYLDVRNIFKKINNCDVDIGRGGSQKSHMASPLDFKLCTYLMAMFNFNYELISSLNTFEDIAKLRYLPCNSVFSKEKINKNLRVKYHISYSPKD
jgi:hypothetical protein